MPNNFTCQGRPSGWERVKYYALDLYPYEQYGFHPCFVPMGINVYYGILNTLFHKVYCYDLLNHHTIIERINS